MQRYLLLTILCCIASCLIAQTGSAQIDNCSMGYDFRHDPRDPDARCIPEVGRITIGLPAPSDIPSLIALGDINGDSLADWAVQTQGPKPPGASYPIINLLIFHGKKGVLPTVQEAQRVGPADTATETTLVALGDFDKDTRLDVVCQILYFSEKKSDGSYPVHLVIYWGQDSGRYSYQDTTELSNGTLYHWSFNPGSTRIDADQDGVEDICVIDPIGYDYQYSVARPKMYIFKGRLGRRWGRNGAGRTADWTWWAPPRGPLTMLDQDKDGNLDFLLAEDDYASILYGKAKQLPDTLNLESVIFRPRPGKKDRGICMKYIDVTGDGNPELIVTVFTDTMRIYAGVKGQRIAEQYGTGNDPPHPDSLKWWGKPWVEFPMPHAINDVWSGAGNNLYNLGDLNLDGVDDIVTYCNPFVIVYTGGKCMDSLIDGLTDTRLGSGSPGLNSKIGDAMGDGSTMYAFRSSTGLVFYRPTKSIPSNCWGAERRLPHVTSGVRSQPDIPHLKLDLTQGAMPDSGQASGAR